MTLRRSITAIFAVSVIGVVSGCESKTDDQKLRAWIRDELKPALLQTEAAVCNLEKAVNPPNPGGNTRLCPGPGDMYQRPPGGPP